MFYLVNEIWQVDGKIEFLITRRCYPLSVFATCYGDLQQHEVAWDNGREFCLQAPTALCNAAMLLYRWCFPRDPVARCRRGRYTQKAVTKRVYPIFWLAGKCQSKKTPCQVVCCDPQAAWHYMKWHNCRIACQDQKKTCLMDMLATTGHDMLWRPGCIHGSGSQQLLKVGLMVSALSLSSLHLQEQVVITCQLSVFSWFLHVFTSSSSETASARALDANSVGLVYGTALVCWIHTTLPHVRQCDTCTACWNETYWWM